MDCRPVFHQQRDSHGREQEQCLQGENDAGSHPGSHQIAVASLHLVERARSTGNPVASRPVRHQDGAAAQIIPDRLPAPFSHSGDTPWALWVRQHLLWRLLSGCGPAGLISSAGARPEGIVT